jgi:PAB1-binding protein PBP1
VQATSFATDTDISNLHSRIGERKLQKFEHDWGELHDVGGLDEPLETKRGKGGGGGGGGVGQWDQFATFQKMTGRTTDFNLDNYSTSLDRSSKFYRDNLQVSCCVSANSEY